MPGDGDEQAAVPLGANLLLCRYAEANDGLLTIVGGGIMVAPSPGSPWYLAGSIDIPSRSVAQGFHLRLLGPDRLPVIGEGGAFIEARVRVSSGNPQDSPPDDGRMLRIPLVVPLPTTEHFPAADSLGEIQYWEFSGEAIRSVLLPFRMSWTGPGEENQDPDEDDR